MRPIGERGQNRSDEETEREPVAPEGRGDTAGEPGDDGQRRHRVVQKDFKVAGATLTETARAQAGGVMKAMPGELNGYEITGVNAAGEETLVTIAYKSADGEALVDLLHLVGRPGAVALLLGLPVVRLLLALLVPAGLR